ncbi:putative mannosyl-oligosaccharide glucosidase [Nadsonia fulvescens var. elongata DSM 6958]|uniref:Mannosyl-oligosaccharide glucosidase n=1 Tax=Nadsonia fulvescens var. elongata DSM 6958 TaxID=857566 RepID=A0A1E3PRK4_9ASCO|nr:putative mannosyl-oligosaccharide glucosidase [Nadsonia fulvescens var. elongata DSM 6958]
MARVFPCVRGQRLQRMYSQGILANGSESLLTNEYTRANNASLLWGPYRSGLYFGVRPRLPKSLLTGLMWFNVDGFEGVQTMRHFCDQNDNMNNYGWHNYDPRSGGRQVISDQGHKIEITTDFVKTDNGHWAVKVKGTPLPLNNENPNSIKTSIVIYTGLEGKGSMKLVNEEDSLGFKESVNFSGDTPDLGKFGLSITRGPKTNKYPSTKHQLNTEKPVNRAHYISLRVPDDNVWKAKDIFLTLLQDTLNRIVDKYSNTLKIPPQNTLLIDDNYSMPGNVHFVQKTFKGSFEFDIIYNSLGEILPITEDNIHTHIDTSFEKFDQTFDDAFEIQSPYNKHPKYSKFAKEFFSNLVGGIGYFHGTSLVDRSYADEYEEDEENFWEAASLMLEEQVDGAQEEGPAELFTAVPSRSFFPRGFYWDEGFHLISILEYDAGLCLDIFKSWFSLIDEDGWIAREQILGPEARSKVPKKFQTQYPHHANPPTMMLLLARVLNKVKLYHPEVVSRFQNGQHMNQDILQENLQEFSLFDDDFLRKAHLKDPVILLNWIRDIYPKLRLHYEWFKRTQRGDIRTWDRESFSAKEGYRWRGRTPRHCLASGLDDYPRSDIPHTGELHVDLLSWVGMMAKSMKEISEVLGEEDDYEDYLETEIAVSKNVVDLHWNEDEKCYCDLSVDKNGESEFVCHKGYISLFPFLLKLVSIDDEAKLQSILDLIYDPKELWSDFGIRSLSKKDKYFGTDENYWRGPIWININYMILDSLRYYGEYPEAKFSAEFRTRASKIYSQLRTNIVDNVFKQWEQTGYGWEQYNEATGKAQGVKHFLGWTSLTVMIMSLPETLNV